jgi:hypothetical protein
MFILFRQLLHGTQTGHFCLYSRSLLPILDGLFCLYWGLKLRTWRECVAVCVYVRMYVRTFICMYVCMY